jgi:pyridoxamine 5'-phosphate oxidase
MATPSRLVQTGKSFIGPHFMASSTLSDRLFDDDDKAPIDPFALFEEWYAEAKASEPNDPHAMAVATVDAAGLPDVRMVLMNARDARGFVFFTNFDSRKGEELLANPRAALVFHWKSLRRQFRTRGPVEIVTPAETDAYFATRARVSQLGANASRQSRPLDRKSTLIDAVDRLKTELGDSAPVPRPANWSGFRIVPIELEFWNDGAFRLHDRVRFSRIDANAAWSRQRLYP